MKRVKQQADNSSNQLKVKKKVSMRDTTDLNFSMPDKGKDSFDKQSISQEAKRRKQDQKRRRHKRKLQTDGVDPKFVRMILDPLLNNFDNTDQKYAHEIVDAIYEENRQAVDREIESIDEVFLRQAVLDKKVASEIELNLLMMDKEQVEKQTKA